MRAAIWALIKGFLFRFDAETAHRITTRMIQIGIKLGNRPLRLASGAPRIATVRSASFQTLPERLPTVFGLEFANRVGLAAGFDKDAEILEGLPALGFGFAEIGTVTPRPQAGNERPRLFRRPSESAVFNRMGFNGLGATIVSERLARVKPLLPAAFRVGVNVGKNKDTPLDKAPDDYAAAVKPFEGLADYLVINVSSPNTPGLRSLQTLESLKPIVGAVQTTISGWKSRPPVLLKLAPEMTGEDLGVILDAGEGMGLAGWILTNTLAGTWARSGGRGSLPGGWSGRPLTERARESLREARSRTRLPIISVGGIMDADEAALRHELGADLVQVYAGWIFGGPSFPVKLARRLSSP